MPRLCLVVLMRTSHAFLAQNPVDARFFSSAYVACENGVRLYIADVRSGVVGGARRDGNDVRPQTLLVQLLQNDAFDKYPAEKYTNDSVSPAKLF